MIRHRPPPKVGILVLPWARSGSTLSTSPRTFGAPALKVAWKFAWAPILIHYHLAVLFLALSEARALMGLLGTSPGLRGQIPGFRLPWPIVWRELISIQPRMTLTQHSTVMSGLPDVCPGVVGITGLMPALSAMRSTFSRLSCTNWHTASALRRSSTSPQGQS